MQGSVVCVATFSTIDNLLVPVPVVPVLVEKEKDDRLARARRRWCRLKTVRGRVRGLELVELRENLQEEEQVFGFVLT